MNKIVKKYPVLGSSIDPTQLSLTVKGALTLAVSIIVPLAIYFGYDLSGVDFSGLIAQIVNAIQVVGLLIGTIATAWGAIRKITNK
jgi:hypothetical protein